MQQYLSPFSLFGVEDVDVKDTSSLNLAKKKLLAEIDLSPTSTVKIGQKELTKNDVLKAFESVSSIQNLDYHRVIASDRTLLKFLTDGTFDKTVRFAKNDVYSDPKFIAFVSPYTVNIYTKLIAQCIENRYARLMENLLQKNPVLLTHSDATTVWNKIEILLSQRLEAFNEKIHQMTNRVQLSDEATLPFYARGAVECLSMLPAEHFASILNQYAMALYDFSTVTLNQGKMYHALEAIKNAHLLPVDAEVQRLLTERSDFLNNELYKLQDIDGGTGAVQEAAPQSAGTDFFRILIVIILIVRLLIFLARLG